MQILNVDTTQCLIYLRKRIMFRQKYYFIYVSMWTNWGNKSVYTSNTIEFKKSNVIQSIAGYLNYAIKMI